MFFSACVKQKHGENHGRVCRRVSSITIKNSVVIFAKEFLPSPPTPPCIRNSKLFTDVGVSRHRRSRVDPVSAVERLNIRGVSFRPGPISDRIPREDGIKRMGGGRGGGEGYSGSRAIFRLGCPFADPWQRQRAGARALSRPHSYSGAVGNFAIIRCLGDCNSGNGLRHRRRTKAAYVTSTSRATPPPFCLAILPPPTRRSSPGVYHRDIT